MTYVNWRESLGWYSLPLEAARNPMLSYILLPLKDHTSHEMHPRDLTALEKAVCKLKADLAIYREMLIDSR